MQVDGGDGVEEGTAGDEEGLDYHGSIRRYIVSRHAAIA